MLQFLLYRRCLSRRGIGTARFETSGNIMCASVAAVRWAIWYCTVWHIRRGGRMSSDVDK